VDLQGEGAHAEDGRRPPPHSRDRKSIRLLAASGKGLPKTSKRTGGHIVTLSGRNQLRGIVEEVRVDGLLAQVRLRVGDQSLTTIITRDAVDELRRAAAMKRSPS
jgi:molybdopterin-binding protein